MDSSDLVPPIAIVAKSYDTTFCSWFWFPLTTALTIAGDGALGRTFSASDGNTLATTAGKGKAFSWIENT